MPTEMTIEAAMIELNRLKTEERMEIDRERLAAAIGVMKDAAQFRIKRKPVTRIHRNGGVKWTNCYCPRCHELICGHQEFCQGFCDACGQALDWSGV